MKPNLILISGFATNSFELKHLISFLSRLANVYFIDLPGFSKDVPPLKKVSIKNYVGYVENEIKKLNLKEYLLGGVSFGFLLAGKVKDSKKCKGILALEPYLNANEIKGGLFNRIIDLVVIKLVRTLKIYKWFWHSNYFKKLLAKNNMDKRVTRMLKTMNAKSFFETAWIILTNKQPVKLKKKPHVLIINKNDELVCAEEEETFFKDNVKNLLIIHTTASHVPKKIPSEKYFEKHLGIKKLKQVINFAKQI